MPNSPSSVKITPCAVVLGAQDDLGRRDLALALAVLAKWLPRDIVEQVGDVLLEANTKFNDYDRRKLCDALALLAQQLPTDRGLKLLITARKVGGDGRRLCQGVAATAMRMPSGEAAEVLLTEMRKAVDCTDQKPLALALVAVSSRMPADRARSICEEAADLLLTTMGKRKHVGSLTSGALGLVAVVSHLSSEHAQDKCEKATAMLTTELKVAASPSDQGIVAIALATVAKRLPTLQITEACSRAADALLKALGDPNSTSRATLAMGLASVWAWLPAERAEVARRVALDELIAALETTDASNRAALANTLWVLVVGLTHDERKQPRVMRPLAAVSGSVILHPSLLPRPRRPLPPQKMVDLLKHPFCVREARRAVLDALELTYDRPFADLWEFVAFAEKEHPDLDLLTPPKRPETR